MVRIPLPHATQYCHASASRHVLLNVHGCTEVTTGNEAVPACCAKRQSLLWSPGTGYSQLRLCACVCMSFFVRGMRACMRVHTYRCVCTSVHGCVRMRASARIPSMCVHAHARAHARMCMCLCMRAECRAPPAIQQDLCRPKDRYDAAMHMNVCAHVHLRMCSRLLMRPQIPSVCPWHPPFAMRPTCVHTCALCMRVCIHVCVRAHARVRACARAGTCAYVHVHMHVNM